ncbi:MAG: hypothetical protein ACPG52_11035 [Cognaticolwellia sp.]
MITIKPFSRMILQLSVVISALSGCQLPPEPVIVAPVETVAVIENRQSYGEYYLTLKQLNEAQLIEEVNKQQTHIEQQVLTNARGSSDPQIKLLLLYSLPKSPIYNSFNAKALLNLMKSEGDNAAFAHITPSEQAFITLLRDQLNQRLLMRNRLLAQQQEQQAFALKQQQQLIERIQLLEQTIKQLKSIEQAIDKRDQ